MKVLLQRVLSACVDVEGKRVSQIETGLLLLAGIHKDDTEKNIVKMAQKVANIRIFSDEKGRFQDSILDRKAQALVVPQFTLFADTKKGRRPEFFDSKKPDEAKILCEHFKELLIEQGISTVEYGVFGANMQVSLVNDGPVTIMLEN